MSHRHAAIIGLLVLIASGCAIEASIAGHLALFPLSFADGMLWLFKADWGLPFLWFALPLSLAASQLLAHRARKNPMEATAFGTRSRIFRHHMGTACALGVVFGIAAWATALALAFLNARDGLANFTDPSSLFALTTGSPAEREPDLPALAASMLAFSISLSCLFSVIAQAALLLLRHPVPVVMALPLLGIPTINRPFEDMFSVTGYGYSSLPGNQHGIFLMVLGTVLLILVFKRVFEQKDLVN